MSDEKVTDWDKIELDYRCGFMTPNAVAMKHEISPTKLKEIARDRGWTQEVVAPEEQAEAVEYIAQSEPRWPIDSLFSPDAIKRQVLLTAGQVVKKHQVQIGKLREISSEMIDRLNKFLEDKDFTHMQGLLGKNDSATDLLEKLSRITVRAVELEREAYGLRNMTIIPDEDENSQISKDIKELSQKLKLLTEDKAQRVENENTGQNNSKTGENTTAGS